MKENFFLVFSFIQDFEWESANVGAREVGGGERKKERERWLCTVPFVREREREIERGREEKGEGVHSK